MTTTLAAPVRRKTGKKTCETCGGKNAQHVNACPDRPERCSAQIDGERCGKDAPHATEPHESKSTGGSLVWGYPEEERFDAPAPDEITTTVDGEDATVVLGGDGAPIQGELLATPLEDRIRAIGRKEVELDEARREKKRASDHVKALEEEHELMVRAAVAQVEGRAQPLPLLSGEETTDETPIVGSSAPERTDPRMASLASEMQTAGEDTSAPDAMRGLRGSVAIESAQGDGPES